MWLRSIGNMAVGPTTTTRVVEMQDDEETVENDDAVIVYEDDKQQLGDDDDKSNKKKKKTVVYKTAEGPDDELSLWNLIENHSSLEPFSGENVHRLFVQTGLLLLDHLLSQYHEIRQVSSR